MSRIVHCLFIRLAVVLVAGGIGLAGCSDSVGTYDKATTTGAGAEPTGAATPAKTVRSKLDAPKSIKGRRPSESAEPQ